MWLENETFREDLAYMAGVPFVPWEELRDKCVLVTGGTGLIGYNVVALLAYLCLERGFSMDIVLLVREEVAARARFAGMLRAGAPLRFLACDLREAETLELHPDYIIHGASPTAGRVFAEHPVETIETIVGGTRALLGLARRSGSRGFLFLSSMEAYGAIRTEEPIDEGHWAAVDPMNPRDSYPEAKRLAEALSAGFASEYDVPAKVLRLTQTFGAGIRPSEGRVFVQFLRSALRGEDIVLHTPGGTKHSYLYTADAVTAIFTVLLRGSAGEAYNATREDTYGSIRELADLVASLSELRPSSDRAIAVRVEAPPDSGRVYPAESYMKLDASKLRRLGWQARFHLRDMFLRMARTQDEG